MAAKVTQRKKNRPAHVKSAAPDPAKDNSLLIAAIGASAGGIEALSDLLTNLAPNTGMAFVLIQHLDPKHHSMLAELLSKKTSMNVREVTDGMRVESDHVYVIPPDATLSITDRTLQLTPREPSHGVHMSIDHFMRSLAEAEGNRAIGVILSGTGTDGTPIRVPAKPPDATWNYLEAQKEFDRRLLSHYAPATVFINEDLEIIHTRGAINRYLKISPGRASLSVLKMAREGLLMDLRNAIGRAKKDAVSVRKHNVEMKDSDSPRGARSIHSIRFEVVPITVGNLKEMYFMVIFQDEHAEPRRGKAGLRRGAAPRQSGASTTRILKLEQELSATKEYLQSVIETQEATNEELQSANEEILSSNEELQSTNEELETAKEELQSANEELTTVNDELRNRNVEVTQANNDLTNLFASIDVAVIMIDRDLTIRRFTPEAQKFLGLIPADIGRPLLNINPTIEIPDFQTMVLTVMSTFHPVEKEIHSRDGARYQLRILPYHTSEDHIDGAVITIIAISSPTASKKADHSESL